MFRKILVPTDGSELSAGTVRAALGLARDNGATLVALNVQPMYRPPVVAEVPVADVYSQDEYEKGARQVGQSLVDAVREQAKAAAVPCSTVVMLDNSPWEGIIHAAKSEACDLIFMASHGRRGMVGLLLGSETQKVLTHCKVPVLVYR